jgi:hypothetical protein
VWVFQDLGYESGGEGSLFRGWRGQVDDVAGSWLMDLCACMCLHKSVSVGKGDGEQRAAAASKTGARKALPSHKVNPKRGNEERVSGGRNLERLGLGRAETSPY